MSKQKWILLFAGIALIAFGAGNTWADLHPVQSPLDSPPAPDGSDLPAGAQSFAAGGAAPVTRPAMGGEKTSAYAMAGLAPDRLVIQAIQLDAPIVPVSYRAVSFDDQLYNQWLAPDKFAVGWDDTSALLGLPGNSVFDGHHNAFGKVFKDLVNVAVGDRIDLYSGSRAFHYEVVIKMLVPERNQPIATRLANARWIAPTTDERITLVTCWPASSNTHRVIVVAYPLSPP